MTLYVVASTSKAVQKQDNLPWMFPAALDRLLSDIDGMILDLKMYNKDLVKNDDTIKNPKFSSPGFYSGQFTTTTSPESRLPCFGS